MSLWICDSSVDEVFEFPDPTDLTTFTRRDLPGTLTSPRGLSFDSAGHMWICDSSVNEVFEFPDPTDLTTFTRRDLPGGTFPYGLSFDSAGHMWICDDGDAEIFEFPDPTDLTTFTRRDLPGALTSPNGMSFDSAGHMWISDNTGNEVFEFPDPTDLTTFTRRDLPGALNAPFGVSFDSAGHMWICDDAGDQIYEFPDPTDLTTSTRRDLPGALNASSGLSFDDRGAPPTIPTQQLSMSARAGNPTAEFNLRAVASQFPVNFSITNRAGVPSFNIDLRSVTQASIATLLPSLFPYPYTPIEVSGFQVEGLRIPVTNEPRQTILLTPLTAEPAAIHIRWSPKLQSWFFDLFTVEQEPINMGVACNQRVFLLNNHNEFFRGNFYIDGPLESEPPIRAQWYPDGPFSFYYISERNYLSLRGQFPWL